jgi:hypothetical protein
LKDIYQIWDKLFKVVGEHYPKELLDFIFQENKSPQFQGKFEQERIVLEYQIADINFWVNDDGVKKLLNIEPYSNWNRKAAAEAFTRNAIITKSLDYQYDVITIVVLLDVKEETGIYETGFGKHENQFHFPVVNFADVKGILKKYPSLAPFLLKVDLKYQKEVLKVIKNQKLLKYITVLILNHLGVSEEEALEMTQANLEEFRELMEIPIMKTVLKDMEKEWEEKGEAKGEAKAKKQSILKILQTKFKTDFPEIEKKLHSFEGLKELDFLVEKAVLADSVKEFETALNKLIKKKK